MLLEAIVAVGRGSAIAPTRSNHPRTTSAQPWLRNRLARNLDGHPTTWDLNSGLPVVLQDGSETYAYGVGGLISQTDGSGNQSYLLGNGLGSNEKLTDGSGNIVATYKYDVFGAVRSSSGSGSAEYRFTGQQDDGTLGYTYLRARYYDPQTGRFLSKDPFPGFLASPATLHYYTYAQNNPVNWTDPSGKCGPLCPVLVVGGLSLLGIDAGLVVAAVGGAVIGTTVARWDDISDYVGSCLEQQGQYLEESASIYYSKKGGASDKSILDGIKGKAAEWQTDKDKIAGEPGSQALRHWEDTSRGLEEAISRDLERLGPKARKEAKEYLEQEYPGLSDALEE